MTDDLINYAGLIDGAMRGVVRDILRKISVTGLPGEHHFYISFLTEYPNVRISDSLHARYPREMTVVLQHQFWDFKVEEAGFTVALSFGGVPEKLYIPFAAITAFADPSIKFGLQFQHVMQKDDVPFEGNTGMLAPLQMHHEDIESAEEASEAQSAEIITLDAFRKK